MPGKERTIYWLGPAVILGILMIFYFSQIPFLVEIVCPAINWEFGILENIQLVILALIFGISIKGLLSKKILLEKVGFGLLALFTVFVFLEEIDYGAHHMKYFFGTDETFFKQLTGERNIHNQNDAAKWYKRPVYPIMGILFIMLPLFRDRIKNPFLNYITPNKAIIATAILSIAVDVVPRLLIKAGLKDGGLGTNIGEFSEVMVYYIFFLYLREIVYQKTWIRKKDLVAEPVS